MSTPTVHDPRDRTGGPRRSRGALAAIAAAVLVAALIVWGYVRGRAEAARARDAEAPIAPPSRTRTVNGERVIEMATAVRSRAGIIVAPVPASTGGGATGYGRVIPLDTLAALHNAYVAAQSAVGAARARADAARREYERLSALHGDQENVSAKAVEQAMAEMQATEAALAAANAPARTLAATARQDWGPVVADWITRGTPEFGRLMSGRDVLVQVTVPFGEVGAAPGAPTRAGADTGAPAITGAGARVHATSAAPPPTARLETGPGAAATARYVSAAARTDPAIQGPSFYYVAPASSTLIPGMNVTATLTGASDGVRATRGAAIPDSAVVWDDGVPWVYVQLDSVTFARRRIALGVPASAGGSFVTTIEPGTPIVVSGAQVLLSEERRAATSAATGEDESP